MSTYELPELPYAHDALEPFISARTMDLHHRRHHAAYVDAANAAQRGLAQARAAGDMSLVPHLTRSLAFNLAGHENHSLFWQNMSPEGGGEPTGDLANALANDFGSLDAFRQQFSALATSIQGSGWAALAHDPASDALVVLQLHDHQSCLTFGCVPLLLLDMWEHAFYLDYLNDKAKYVEAFWEVVDWKGVAARYDAAAASV